MRVLLFALVLTALPASADAPPRRGGFFGFGASRDNELSAGLFPSNAADAASEGTPSDAEGIFRDGHPRKVDPVSYTIQNGSRVERPLPAPVADPSGDTAAAADAALDEATVMGSEEKRGGFLGFGKRRKNAQVEHPEIAPPTPAPAAPPLAATPLAPTSPPPLASPLASPEPVAKKGGFFRMPFSRNHSPEAIEAPEAIDQIEAPEAVKARESVEKRESPAFVEEKKERFGWIPFLGRNKDEEPPAIAADSVPLAMPVASAPAPAPAPSSPAPRANAEAPRADSSTPAAKPVSKKKPTTPAQVATFEIRRDESNPGEKKKDGPKERQVGLLPSIPKILPERTKEIDLTGAETIIQNGEIVGDSGSSYTSIPGITSAPSEPRKAPQVIDGVKTYSSWNDVEARSTSAADKILERIR